MSLKLLNLEYYSNHAEQYSEETAELDLAEAYRLFLPHVPDGGQILDAGCGPGRDSSYFSMRGYEVTSFDPCAEFVEIGRSKYQLSIQKHDFRSFQSNQQFDGIWCLASMLHLERGELLPIFQKFSSMLKPGGVLFASFKHGSGELRKSDRVFTLMNDQLFEFIHSQLSGVDLIERDLRKDARPGRESEEWISFLLRRQHIESSMSS